MQTDHLLPTPVADAPASSRPAHPRPANHNRLSVGNHALLPAHFVSQGSAQGLMPLPLQERDSAGSADAPRSPCHELVPDTTQLPKQEVLCLEILLHQLACTRMPNLPPPSAAMTPFSMTDAYLCRYQHRMREQTETGNPRRAEPPPVGQKRSMLASGHPSPQICAILGNGRANNRSRSTHPPPRRRCPRTQQASSSGGPAFGH